MSVAIIGVVVTAAGLAYTAYSADNPPKTPAQATAALTKDNQTLAKLQQKLAQAQAAGKDTSKIQAGITKVQATIQFLQSWIAQNGDTTARAAKAAQAVGQTAVAAPAPSAGAYVPNQPGQNWPLIIGGGAVAVALVGGAIYLKKRKKKS